MNKPISMSVKDYLIRVMSVRNNIPLKTIEAVVDFQLQEAHKALYNEHTVELSGFGKFIFNVRKALRKREKIISSIGKLEKKVLDPDINEIKRNSLIFKLKTNKDVLQIIETKLKQNGTEQDYRGLEKQITTSPINGESYRGDSSPKEDNL